MFSPFKSGTQHQPYTGRHSAGPSGSSSRPSNKRTTNSESAAKK